MELLDKQLDCALIKPKIISDLRGNFTVPFSVMELQKLGLEWNETYQINHSFTNEKGTVRGPNYQEPFPQAKIIRCVRGSLYSVGICLDGENKGKHAGYNS